MNSTKKILGNAFLIASLIQAAFNSNVLANPSLNDDLFSSLDEVVEQDKAVQQQKKDQGFFAKILENSDFKLTTLYSGYYDDAYVRSGIDTDTRKHLGDIRFNFGTKYDLWEGSTFHFSGWLEGGNHRDTYRGVTSSLTEDDRNRRWVELNELYWTGKLGPLGATAGKKVFKMGMSSLYSPMNRISPWDFNDPMNPKQYGVWQTTGDLSIGDTSLSLAILPVYQPSKYPSRTSRWSSAPDSRSNPYLFYGQRVPTSVLDVLGLSEPEAPISQEPTTVRLRNMRYVAQMKTTVSGWDLLLGVHHGLSLGQVLRQENRTDGSGADFIVQNVLVLEPSFGFSTVTGAWEFHGETLFSHPYGNKDDQYITYVGGFTVKEDEFIKKLFFDSLEFTLEYGGEKITRPLAHSNIIQSSRVFRKIRNNIMWRLYLTYNPDLTLGYFGTWELGGVQGGIHTVGARYRLDTGLYANLSSEFLRGHIDSTYGQWRHNSRYVLRMEYTF